MLPAVGTWSSTDGSVPTLGAPDAAPAAAHFPFRTLPPEASSRRARLGGDGRRVNRVLAPIAVLATLLAAYYNALVVGSAWRAHTALGKQQATPTMPNTDTYLDHAGAHLDAGRLALVATVLGVLCIVSFLFSLTRAIRRHREPGRYTPGWAIGGWVVPVANLWIPGRVFAHDERVARAALDGAPKRWHEVRLPLVSRAWWPLFVVGGIAERSALYRFSALDDLYGSSADRLLLLSALGATAFALAFAACAFVIGRLTVLDLAAPR